jgi:replicative DNA helicase
MSKPTYGYSDDFQNSVAAFLLRDPTFIRDYSDVVDPTYFDHPALTSVVRIGKDLYERNGEIPSKALLLEELKDYCESYHIPHQELDDIFERAERVYTDKLLDVTSIRERVVKFGQRQAVKQGLVQIADLVESDDGYERAVDILETAMRVGFNANELGLNFFDKLLDLPKMARREDRGFVHKIKTGLPIFDQYTLGGTGRGEIWVILGLSGQGKSQFLVNMGVQALQQGFSVVHITVGDLDEEDVGIRYAARICGCSQLDVVKEEQSFLRKATMLKKMKSAYLRIKYYDPGVVTVSHIKAYLSKLWTVDEIKPGLLILDYPDEFKKPKAESDYQAMGEIYGQIKTLIRQYNCGCWAASQVHRWFPRHRHDVLTRNNIADSAKKVHKADGIASINQTWDEADAGKARLWVDKVRRGKQFFLVPLDVDYAAANIKQGLPFDDGKEDDE